jgi:diphosphomevalonate decarboxylase
VANAEETARVTKQLDLIRKIAKVSTRALVESKNNFPKGSGIASSASGFAALTVAACASLSLKISEREMSILARLGSGSACRSIPDGFVEWKEGGKSSESYAHTIFEADYWDLRDLIVICGSKVKKVSSTEGHAIAESSPFYKSRIAGMKSKVKELKSAFKKRDFTRFGEIIEAEAVNMHSVMMTSNPPLYYWNSATLSVMTKIWEMREKGIESYFTIDAGHNVHLICEAKNASKIKKLLSKLEGVTDILVNKPAVGARII